MHSFLYTLSKPRSSYADFIRNDHDKRLKQVQCLLALRELQAVYLENNVSESAYADWNNFSRRNGVDWAFELFQMRRAVMAGRQHTFNVSISPSFTRQANDVFLLAMLRGHAQIVSFFLTSKVVHVNQSIFGSKFWPSYYLLACTCGPAVISEFQKCWANQSIAWNGLTASILLGIEGQPLESSTYLDFISYQQFVYLNRYRGVELLTEEDSSQPNTTQAGPAQGSAAARSDTPSAIGSATNTPAQNNTANDPATQHKHFNKPNFNLPIFLLDFACMRSDKRFIKEILDCVPEAGALSRLSFIVQSEEHLILILSRYGFRTDQQFNGHTPLHISCYNNDFCTLSILLYLDFPIVRDSLGRFPNEVGSHKMREKSSIFFNLCADIPVSRSGCETRRFSRAAFREHMTTWMKVLKYNSNEFDKYTGIFRYLDFNKYNKILRKSRFNSTNIFSSSRSPVSVELCEQWLAKHSVALKAYGASEALILYSRFYG